MRQTSLLVFCIISLSLSWGCEHGEYYPHSTDCDKFIRCNFGQEIVFQCGETLWWNSEFGGCDYPHVTNCQSENANSKERDGRRLKDVEGDEEIMETAATNLDPHSLRQDDLAQAETQREEVQKSHEDETFVKDDDCTDGQFTVHPSDCSKYFLCRRGYQIVFSCGELHWNKILRFCDFPERCDCIPGKNKNFEMLKNNLVNSSDNSPAPSKIEEVRVPAPESLQSTEIPIATTTQQADEGTTAFAPFTTTDASTTETTQEPSTQTEIPTTTKTSPQARSLVETTTQALEDEKTTAGTTTEATTMTTNAEVTTSGVVTTTLSWVGETETPTTAKGGPESDEAGLTTTIVNLTEETTTSGTTLAVGTTEGSQTTIVTTEMITTYPTTTISEPTTTNLKLEDIQEATTESPTTTTTIETDGTTISITPTTTVVETTELPTTTASVPEDNNTSTDAKPMDIKSSRGLDISIVYLPPNIKEEGTNGSFVDSNAIEVHFDQDPSSSGKEKAEDEPVTIVDGIIIVQNGLAEASSIHENTELPPTNSSASAIEDDEKSSHTTVTKVVVPASAIVCISCVVLYLTR